VAAGLDRDYVLELFAAFGPVSVRRMFGGAGIFADGLMIAIVADGVIYLKAGTDAAAFEREGCAPFAYATKNGTRGVMSYWRMPERLYDDPDELTQWARAALAVAQAGPAAKARPKRAAPAKKKRIVRA